MPPRYATPCCLIAFGPDPQLQKYKSAHPPSIASTYKGTTEISCSGLLIEDGTVLCSPIPVAPFLQSNNEGYLYRSGVKVIVETDTVEVVQARFKRFISINTVRDALHQIVKMDPGGWVDGNGRSTSESSMSTLAILEVNMSEHLTDRIISMKRVILEVKTKVEPGLDILLFGAPFGVQAPNVFINSVVHGVISNSVIVKRSDETEFVGLFISDAKYLPCMDGGPAVLRCSKSCIGIITTSLRRKADQTIEITLIIPWPLVEKELASYEINNEDHANERGVIGPATTSRNLGMETVIRATVLIQIGNTWASGVVITTQGHILTNAHVVSPFVDKGKLNAKIRFAGEIIDHVASLLFCSTEYWDLALLKIVKQTQPLKLVSGKDCAQALASTNTTVYTAGYGNFDPMAELKPTISKGKLGRLVAHPKDSSIFRMQISAMTQNGCS
ncbi:hypothetical protein HDU76_011636 [Blyttiomyces sp. JEL0837]|nr:hypothetical protein HDU76_011636 [Blyttiomyces sp. JEL0837]